MHGMVIELHGGRRTSTGQAARRARSFIRCLLSLCLVAPLLTSPRSSAARAVADVEIVRPVADAYVTKALPRQNHGAAKRLRADALPTKRAYLKFDLRRLDRDIKSAVLRVLVRRGARIRHRLHLVRDNGWRELKIDFSTAPSISTRGLYSRRTSAGSWLSVDVTRWARRHELLGLAITTVSRRSVAYASRESRRGAPRLVVELAPPSSRGEARLHRVYAYYYLWWSRRHWFDKLGPDFPYSRDPWPLPATLDESGCNPQNLYEGNQLIDAPEALYGQDDPGVIERHVRQAASAGIAGFVVNWRGTGEPDQDAESISYSRRLAEIFRAVTELGREGIDFKIWLNYKASSTILPTEYILNDLAYLEREYATSPALDRFYSDRPMLVWVGSRKYDLETIRTVAGAFRDTFFLVGDENWHTWGDGRAAYLDGNHYYWSTQNPYTNPHSFERLRELAAMVRSSGPNPDGSEKLWFAPLTPGYNSLLNGGSTCVPRSRGQTMRDLFEGNLATDPDAWVFISWNEIAENTHIEPLQRWGTFYLDALSEIIQGR
jgi:hypothetical protein